MSATAPALSLQDGDSDGAVNRAYYAMFNLAQAALLSIGVSEEQLLRTHRGLIAAFGQHAVQSGRVNAGVAGVLGRTETLRLKADYTGTEIDARTASLVLSEAETFVRTVEREFALELTGTAAVEPQNVQSPPDPIEEERRQARENWLRLREQQLEDATGAGESEPGLDLGVDRPEDD